MSKRCIIFGALDISRLPVTIEPTDLVIAADKGYLTTQRFKIPISRCVGDFDSLGYLPVIDDKTTLPTHKNDTDTGFAIKEALKEGCDEFIIIGAIGGREDMTCASLQLIAALSRQGYPAVLYGEKQNALALTNRMVSFPPATGLISVFADGVTAKGVTLKGLEYELEDAELSPLYPIGVSNSFVNRPVTISVKDGTLLVFWENKSVPLYHNIIRAE